MVNPKTLSLAIVILLLNIAQVGAEGLSVDVDLHEVRAGEPADISASISVPDLPGSHEAELTTKLYVDGEQVSSKKITVRDGETTSASFTHTFSQGSHNVKVECAVSLGGTSISGSRSISVDIKPEVTSTPEPEVLETPEKVKITTEGCGICASRDAQG